MSAGMGEVFLQWKHVVYKTENLLPTLCRQQDP